MRVFGCGMGFIFGLVELFVGFGMVDEWVFQVVIAVVPAVLTLFVGYFLGLRSQRKQTLHEYVVGTVKEEYPLLFDEIRRNSEMLDSFLLSPDVHFDFPHLESFFGAGLDSLMKKYHKDLFQSASHFEKHILPGFKKLYRFKIAVHENLYKIWQSYLHQNLPELYKDLSSSIASDLIRTINPHYVLPELLTQNHELLAQKVKKCITEKTAKIRKNETQMKHTIKKREVIDNESIAESLIKLAEPTIENILRLYRYLKEQNDKEVKEKLLPLLQKYMSSPI